MTAMTVAGESLGQELAASQTFGLSSTASPRTLIGKLDHISYIHLGYRCHRLQPLCHNTGTKGYPIFEIWFYVIDMYHNYGYNLVFQFIYTLINDQCRLTNVLITLNLHHFCIFGTIKVLFIYFDSDNEVLLINYIHPFATEYSSLIQLHCCAH